MSNEARALLLLAKFISQQHDDMGILIMCIKDEFKCEPTEVINRWNKNKEFVEQIRPRAKIK